ncbi:multidrug resistance-associated ABC transporter [Coniophora puteana RWD-64-598 SS2]|uniref:Multidrug resistance-associated ABC transporter n=1 Tax=Coniophora puteana (strain RWD-64-598) TaxID=741705 RepID=A0A5M3MVY9_CONPW|nr:multidrug resistance-associated ABC transporter [Coniophora puteana RWD-64-598 SS2]EIW83220.1 multidrug resistance-associated ABC transporter [Coniophora puteana RWD-64-598 SS2]
MIDLHLLASAVLVATAGTSLVLHLLLAPKDSQIKLPTATPDALSESPAGSLRDDPFDISQPEDTIEGYPIYEDKFWAKVRLRKHTLSATLGLVFVFQEVSLGWSIVELDFDMITVDVLLTAYAMYTYIYATRSTVHTTIDSHVNSLIHLSVLTLLPFVLLLIVSIIPSGPPFETSMLLSRGKLAYFKYIVELLWPILYFVATVVTWTTPSGPALHFPPEDIYLDKTAKQRTDPSQDNVCGYVNASSWSQVLFSYTTKVVMFGYASQSLEISDLPILPLDMRGVYLYTKMQKIMQSVKLRWAKPGSGWQLGWRIFRANAGSLIALASLSAVSGVLWYTPPLFLEQLVKYLESDPERKDRSWGWALVVGMFLSNALTVLVTSQLWSLCSSVIQCRIRLELNSILFQKTLVRKDVASSAPRTGEDGSDGAKKDEDEDFASKAQIMTLMTTDTDRVSDCSRSIYSLVDVPIELVIGSLYLYKLLGVSCFVGLACTVGFLPINSLCAKITVHAQEKLMKARDERVSLMNEILGAIRMLKFMAWERSFEKKVLKVREKELKAQKTSYMIGVLFEAVWDGSPIVVTLVSFWHFAFVRQQTLTPSIAFTSILVFQEMKFALHTLPELALSIMQAFVSLRRIEKYLNGAEVDVSNPEDQPQHISLQNASITWPQHRGVSASATSTAPPTPRNKFVLHDLSFTLPQGELSLICGKLGSGKSLMLLALLGEADVLTGQLHCPRSSPNILAYLGKDRVVKKEDWIVKGVVAYVPQSAWLRNASIKDNILFNLPLDEERYQKTLEACALLSDLRILEDGDESEIGEKGVNLSGGQKARVSLARAVYSRASVILLDDVLSAVDAHTAHHLYHECIKGELMHGRTIVLVSHHVQLASSGAGYVVALDNGRVIFQGDRDAFQASPVMDSLAHSVAINEDKVTEEKEGLTIEDLEDEPETSTTGKGSEGTPTVAAGEGAKVEHKAPRKLIEEEKRVVGRIGRDIWKLYVTACGGSIYWTIFTLSMLAGAVSPVVENWWLKTWSGASAEDTASNGVGYYMRIYALVTLVGLCFTTFRYFIVYSGSITASTKLFKRMLESVLFADIRFHDTVSRGRLLNRFGKDFEVIDSQLADNFGRFVWYGLAVAAIVVTVTYIGGWVFVPVACVLGWMYYQVAKVYGQTSRDMRRLDSVARSPLYSIYGETIAGVTVIRAFGASSKFLRDMIRCADTNANPFYWLWSVNRWVSTRFNLLSSALVCLTGLVAVISPNISAALAGFALAFATSITGNILYLVRRFVGVEQSMVALERVKEFSELKAEAPEFIEPRPPASWPAQGSVVCEDLVIRYAPDLPDVLHHLSFEIRPGEKVGILGRTGSGKSTLALSFFRFVEATEGRILVDGIDISKIGLSDLRSALTIIPQDPVILSGTLRSTLDVFGEYEDADIFEALKRVHLIPSDERVVAEVAESEAANENVFRNLDSPVSEGGENFSAGEKQLLCMARAILKRSKVLVMDEATASVDYATDELISKTIRQEFASSTIMTIAHRLRTVIDYDRVMVLDEGRIVEFDKPSLLLREHSSKFYSLCKATGKKEFGALKKMAGL